MDQEELASVVTRRTGEGHDIKSVMLQCAAEERGLDVTRLSSRVVLVDAGAAEPLVFYNLNGPSSSQGGKYLCDAKHLTRRLLDEQGFAVTASRLLSADDADQAWGFASSLDAPAVVKPNNLSRGKGVTTGITGEDSFRAAWERARSCHPNQRRTPELLVEEQFTGDDYRFFVVLGETPTVFATLRRRSSVLGDGERTVEALVKRKNRRRSRNPYLGTYPIPTDPTELDLLRASERDTTYVPGPDERVFLRSVSNLSSGGDSLDYTDRVHAGFRDIVIEAVRTIPGMRYAGVDIIAPSVRAAPTPHNHIISEVEYSPAPITHFPWYGQSRDMAGTVLEYYLAQH